VVRNEGKMTLEELLQNGVLYAKGETGARVETGQYGSNYVANLPGIIRLRCSTSKCSTVLDWRLHDQIILHAGTARFSYDCVQCGAQATFFVNVVFGQRDKTYIAVVTLAGRWPRAEPNIEEDVRRALSETDLYLFGRAVDSRANGAGIGAMSYMRRVVENEMNRLLDLLIGLLASDPNKMEQLQRAKELRSENRFEEKARVADAVLPPAMFPGSQNPFAKLHDLCSNGIHELDDAESCERFDDARDVFELLFQKLHRERETAKLYEEKLKKLESRKRS